MVWLRGGYGKKYYESGMGACLGLWEAPGDLEGFWERGVLQVGLAISFSNPLNAGKWKYHRTQSRSRNRPQVVSSHCPHSLLAHTYFGPIFVPNAPRFASDSPYISSSFLQSAFLLDLFFFFLSAPTMPASLVLARNVQDSVQLFFYVLFYEFSYFVFSLRQYTQITSRTLRIRLSILSNQTAGIPSDCWGRKPMPKSSQRKTIYAPLR